MFFKSEVPTPEEPEKDQQFSRGLAARVLIAVTALTPSAADVTGVPALLTTSVLLRTFTEEQLSAADSLTGGTQAVSVVEIAQLSWRSLLELCVFEQVAFTC